MSAVKPKMSARAAAIEILTGNGAPMHIKDITAKVLADFDTGLKGKTPVATLGAQLHTAAKKGVGFVKTDKGTFGLLATGDVPAAEPVEAATAEEDSPLATPNATVVRIGDKQKAKPDPKPSGGSRSRAKVAA